MNNLKHSIAHFLSAVVISKIITVATTILIVKLLSPADYGVWTTLLTIMSLVPIINFGALEALVKQVPYYIGSKKYDLVSTIDGGVFASILFSSGLLALSALAFKLLGPLYFTRDISEYVFIILIASIIELIGSYYYFRLIAYNQFKPVSLINSVRAILTFIFYIVLSLEWHLKGLVIAALSIETLILILSYVLDKRTNCPISFRPDLELIISIIKIGFPISALWWSYMVLNGSGRLISMKFLGRIATGYYSLGVSIISLLSLIPMAVGQVFYPSINELVGKQAHRDSISKYVVFPAQIISLAVAALLGCFFCMMPFIIQTFFAKYSPAIATTKILFCSGYFICLVKAGANYLIAINKQFSVLKFVLFSLIANIIISLIAIKSTSTIEGIAMATSISSAILTTLIWRSVFQNLGYSRLVQFKKLFELYFPFIFMISSIMIMNEVITIHFSYQAIVIGINLLVFSFLYAAAIFVVPSFRAWIILLFQKIRY